MDRLKASQKVLSLSYKAYNEVAAKPLAPLKIDDSDVLKKLLDTVMNRESISHLKNNKAQKESTELRSALADVLLLLDGCDIKEIKAKMKKETA